MWLIFFVSLMNMKLRMCPVYRECWPLEALLILTVQKSFFTWECGYCA